MLQQRVGVRQSCRNVRKIFRKSSQKRRGYDAWSRASCVVLQLRFVLASFRLRACGEAISLSCTHHIVALDSRRGCRLFWLHEAKPAADNVARPVPRLISTRKLHVMLAASAQSTVRSSTCRILRVAGSYKSVYRRSRVKCWLLKDDLFFGDKVGHFVHVAISYTVCAVNFGLSNVINIRNSQSSTSRTQCVEI